MLAFRCLPQGVYDLVLPGMTVSLEPVAILIGNASRLDFYGKNAQSRMQDDKICFTLAASLPFAAKPYKGMEYGIVIGKPLSQGIVDQLLTVTAMEVLVNGRIKSSNALCSYIQINFLYVFYSTNMFPAIGQ